NLKLPRQLKEFGKSRGRTVHDPGCVKTLRGIIAPGILGSTVMRRAKKRKNLSSARHYDQIRFRFHTWGNSGLVEPHSGSHGGGRDLKGIANFANGKRCAKNFSNAMDSRLTAGGAYVTGEVKTSFKGYYRASAKHDAVLIRSFVQFDGEGEVANARQREIGGHPAELLRNVCLRKDPHSSYADRDGYIPYGQLEDYADGRSNGCTSWSPSDAGQIIAMVKEGPTTLYIYPESADIEAVARAVKAGRS